MFKYFCSLALCGLTLGYTGFLSAQTEALRDPTQPLSYHIDGPAAKGQLKLTLNSVLIGAERKLAIVNGQTVRENDVIKGTSGARVKTISPNQVVIVQGEKVWRLSLNTTTVRH